MAIKKRVTTKRFCAGEYNVIVLGEFAGNITTNGNELGEWICFDKDNEWIATTDTKWEALTNY
tara:strand:+ start:239 stop:427 length:189 start_codon:yes stop_codon:yes gene_type:complete